MNPSITPFIRIYKSSLDGLAEYYVAEGTDDAEYIRIVRVLISTAVGILVEDGETDGTIGAVELALREHARDFYVSQCAKNHSEISNISVYKDECVEIFDYIFQHGRYPD